MEHGLIEDPRHHVDVLAQVAQDLPGVLRGVVEGDELELGVRAVLLELGPQVHQHLGGGHGGCADADDLTGLLHGVPCPGDGVFAVLDDVFGVLVQGLARLGQLQPPVGAQEEAQVQVPLQEVDLLDHRRGGDVELLRSPVEAAGLGHGEEGFQLGVVHGASPSLLPPAEPGAFSCRLL